MRLVTRRIYRAFPELDRFDDVQCQKFVRAARGSGLRRSLRGLFMFGVILGGVIAGGAGYALLVDRISPRNELLMGPLGEKLLAVGLLVLTLTPGPVLAFVLRDWLLRRRVKFVLRTRGVCRTCWYSLVGLPIGEKNLVQCPECGAVTEVDESLNELVIDEDGQRRFGPDAASKELAARYWTPQRVRTVKRYSLRTIAGLILAALIAGGGYEIFLRRQAATARAAQNGAARLSELVRKQQPSTSPEDDAWPHLAKAVELHQGVDAEVWNGSNRPVTSTGTQIQPRFDAIYDKASDLTESRAGQPPDMEYANACVDLARRMLNEYEARGVYAQLAEAAARPAAMRPIDLAEGDPMFKLLLPSLGQCRSIARVSAARMQLALEADDPARFGEALQQGLAVARITSQQPLLIDGWVGTAIESLMLERMEKTLRQSPRSEFIDAMTIAITQQPVPPFGPYHMEGERIAALDNIAWVFAQPSRVRWGPMSPALTAVLGTSNRSGRLSTFAENVRATNAHFDDLVAQLKAEPFERGVPSTTPSDLTLLNLLLPTTNRLTTSHDQITMKRRGLIVMLALEQHRHRSGAYPESLASLPVDLQSVAFRDPYSGKPLGYRRLDAPDAHGRGYILYSVGHDGRDDGGADVEAARRKSGTLQVGPGDIILNEPPPTEKP